MSDSLHQPSVKEGRAELPDKGEHEPRRRPRWSLVVVGCLVAGAAAVKLLDLGFVYLNLKRIILPQFTVVYLPYHDPRVTARHEKLLRYGRTPQLIFTGDSRTKNGVRPQVIASTLGIDPELMFNFGTGSQVIAFARQAFVPHLLRMNRRPKYLVFGVTPDWLLNKQSRKRLIGLYERSPRRFLEKLDQAEEPVEARLTAFMIRHLAIYRYRGDFIDRELVPDLNCWFFGDCNVTHPIGSMPYKEEEYLSSIQDRYGWSPQPWDGRTAGHYVNRPRFTAADEVDRQDLVGLIRQVRQEGIEPVFLMMPLHRSFWEAHKDAMPGIVRTLREVAGRERVDVLDPKGDYSDPKFFVDGHHLSRKGAAYLGADIAAHLRPYLVGSGAEADKPQVKAGGA